MTAEDLRARAAALPTDKRLHLVGGGKLPSQEFGAFLDGVVARAPVDGLALRQFFERESILLYIADNKPLNTIGLLVGPSFIVLAPVALTEWQRRVALLRVADVSGVHRKKPLFGLGPLTLTFSLVNGITPRVPDGTDASSEFFGYFDEFSLEDVAKANRDFVAEFVEALVRQGGRDESIKVPTGFLG